MLKCVSLAGMLTFHHNVNFSTIKNVIPNLIAKFRGGGHQRLDDGMYA